MPDFIHRRWHGLHMVAAIIVVAIFTVILVFTHWFYAILGLIALVGLSVYAWYAEKEFEEDFLHYLSTLSQRIRRAGNEVVQHTPVGMILYDEGEIVQWHNEYSAQLLHQGSLLTQPLGELLPALSGKLQKDGVHDIHVQDLVLRIQVYAKERLLFLSDITELTRLKERYQQERLAVGIVHIDNLDELEQVMEEQEYSLLMARVSKVITDWAQANRIFIRRMSMDKFLAITHYQQLERLMESRFAILDEVRHITQDNKLPLTLSIGFGAEGQDALEVGQWAAGALEVALGRGGDQAAVKIGESLTFYGGKSNAVEKRTRVRARVISHALRNLIRESDQVLIMGHRYPDLDAIGAAIGVLRMVHANDKKGYIVLDGPNPGIEQLLEEVQEDQQLRQAFVTPEEALHLCTKRSLMVMVDNHRPSMAIEPRLFGLTTRVVIIDHHRRSGEMVEDPLLTYIEPFASSASEMVSELLQYQADDLNLPPLWATALLAGIVVDTKNFNFRTGSRTFEAASYLRRQGAEPEAVQRLMKEGLSQFLRRVQVMQHTEMYRQGVALITAPDDELFDQLLIAQTADSLLTVRDVVCSFVVARRPDGIIGVSARSTGEVNVQLIMEALGGGGHMTNAAAQFAEGTSQEVARLLKQQIDRYFKERGEDGK